MELLTYSAMQSFKNCRRHYYYSYELCLRQKREKSFRRLGTAFHKAMETRNLKRALAIYDGLEPNSQDEADAIDTEKAVATGMIKGALKAFKDLQGTKEMKFIVPIENPQTGARSRTFSLAGKIDEVVDNEDEIWIVEYKTAAQINKAYIDRLQLDSQITTYSYSVQRLLGRPVAGIIYRIAKKPSLRRRKNETLFEFQDRITADYEARPEFYFDEQKLYRSQDDLDEFQEELWQITQDILTARRKELWYKNTSRCAEWGGCEFLPLCLKYEHASLLYETIEKNPELKEGA